MKTLGFLPLSAFLGYVWAAPAAKDIVFPPNGATIVPVKSSGTGCPGEGADRRTTVIDYMRGARDTQIWTYALNLPSTMGAAIFPDVKGEQSKSCVHEWKIVNAPGYRLNVDKKRHLNSCSVQTATGNHRCVEDHVFVIDRPIDRILQSVDEIRIARAIDPMTAGQEFARSTVPTKKWKTGCEDKKVINMKTEVTLEGETNLSATVWPASADDFYGRILQGFTYDREKC
ncbi:hypothetical protein K469DRAFT_691652 [Zopfia rhizophila CBS 207.26]|uniref:Uncharacterized protein n=1 Tax=Zopfia rhizophila CBS 207.26 TaxID=1314779 RepID=A0A6A6DSK2_9PEZI|nr:hypothetical protein K469DRAFT_691652 [Zopfia rhizophila CBS 207.26]